MIISHEHSLVLKSIRAKFLSFFKCKKAEKNKAMAVEMLKQSSSIFIQIYIATNTREVDLDLFFSHDVHAFPTPMANTEEFLYSTKIPEIIHCLDKAVTASNNIISEGPNYVI